MPDQNDTHITNVDDMERVVDSAAIQAGTLAENPTLDAVALALDGDQDSSCCKQARRQLATKLLQMAAVDMKAFACLALKAMFPTMTHADLAVAMKALGHANWSNRARSCNRLNAMLKRQPELAGVLQFDRRGGTRKEAAIDHQIRRAYEEMLAEERAKAPNLRRPSYGKQGLYSLIAARFSIKGVFGSPSWRAARCRIQRLRRSEKA